MNTHNPSSSRRPRPTLAINTTSHPYQSYHPSSTLISPHTERYLKMLEDTLATLPEPYCRTPLFYQGLWAQRHTRTTTTRSGVSWAARVHKPAIVERRKKVEKEEETALVRAMEEVSIQKECQAGSVRGMESPRMNGRDGGEEPDGMVLEKRG